MKRSRILFVVLLALGMTLAFTLSARAFEIQNDLALAPAGQPHRVNFETFGLASNIPIVITGSSVNNGGQSNTFTVNFNSPGPSGSINTKPGSDVVYFNGFQDQYIIGSTVYSLTNISPTSPFTAGLSGDTTTVLATYKHCSTLVIANQPVNTTVVVGASATFSVTLANASSASYQWYKDGLAISGATGSQYTINSAAVNDSGTYYVVISSLCEMLQSNSADLTVTKRPQTIDFPQPASPAVYNTSFSVSPSASSGLTVTVQASGGCTLNVGQVTMTSGSQDCTLTASQAGDANYQPAANVAWVVTAAKAAQTVDFPQPASPAVYNTSFSISPSASSGLTVTVQASGGCTLNVGQVTMTSGSQDCTLTASQAGDANYLPAANVAWVVTAAKAAQAIDFLPPPSSAIEGSSFSVNPTADSGLPVSLTAFGSCTAAGYLVTITQPSGTCTLTASQVGDANYNPAEPVVHTVQAVPFMHYLFFPVVH